MNPHSQTFHRLVERNRRQLNQAASSGHTAGIAPRARAILLIAQGLSVREVALATGLAAARIQHYRRRFLCLGMPGLSDPEPLSRSRARWRFMAALR